MYCVIFCDIGMIQQQQSQNVTHADVYTAVCSVGNLSISHSDHIQKRLSQFA